MKTEDTLFEKLSVALFKDATEAEHYLSVKEMEVRKRWMAAFSKWYDAPHTSTKDIVTFLSNGCGGITEPVSYQQAYKDIVYVQRLLGNIQQASKAWSRYMVIEMARQAYIKAEAKGDAKSMALAANTIGKYTRLDKEEKEPMDWERMIPPSFEPSDDVTLVEGVKPVENIEAYRKKMRSLFKGKNTMVEDVIPIEEHE